MTPVTPPLPASRGVAALLPLLYVAWADGVLSPSQAAQLRERVAEADWLTDPDRDQLARWLDPRNPPAPALLAGWARAVRNVAQHSRPAGDCSLAELGGDLAAMVGGGLWTPEAARAVAEMEGVLGVAGREAVRALVSGDGMEGPPPEAPAPEPPDTVDVDALGAALDGPRAALRARVRTLLRDPLFQPPDPEVGKDAYRDTVLDHLRLLAEQGLGGLAYPSFVGGAGDIGAFIAVFETLAYGDLSLTIKFGVQFGLFGGSINALGSEAQRRRWLPDTASLALPGCFAMTERGHGSNVRDLKTTATYDPATQTFEIRTPGEADHKEWIGNAARHARMASVFARLIVGGEDYGVHALLVPIRDEAGNPLPGVRIADSGYKMGLNGVDNGRLWFDGVKVPREHLLDRFAQVSPEGAYTSDIPSSGARFFTMLGTLVGGRIAVGSGAVSVLKSALTIAVRYGDRRRQFGPKGVGEVPILDNLSHQRRLLPRVAEAYALQAALHSLTERFQSYHAAHGEGAGSDAIRPLETEAAALKALASRLCTDGVQEAREACGGEGYRWDNRIPALKADSDIFTTFEGDNTILLLQVAKSLLGDYRESFQSLDFFGLLGVLRERVEARLGEPNPLVRRRTAEDHLLSPQVHLDLFRDRERQLLLSAAARLKGRLDRGADSFASFVEVQDHLLTLARAHAERVVLEHAQAAAREATPAARPMLERLAALYALSVLERERGWYLEENYFDAPKAKAIRAEVNTLCRALRPHVVALVDAFRIPDELLQAPIAMSDEG
ncbi:MAG TPA: acyl-CoA dehydrogenase [Rhodothermales bacterium]|nr:acyl-CoA dehydrogenase [Rhodothermales bacterium]